MANNHNPVELTGNIFVHHPVVLAYKVREAKEREAEIMRFLEPEYEDRYGIKAA